MAMRRFWCKMLARKRVCECVEETPKDKLTSKPVMTFTNKNYDEKPAPIVTRPVTINPLSSADPCPTYTPAQASTSQSLASMKSATSLDMGGSANHTGSAPASCAIPNIPPNPQFTPATNPQSSYAAPMNSATEYAMTPNQVSPGSSAAAGATSIGSIPRQSSARSASVNPEEISAKSSTSAPVSPSKEHLSRFDHSKTISKLSDSSKASTSKTKESFRRTKELFSKLSKSSSSSKESKVASETSVSRNKLKPKTWPSVTKPEIIPVSSSIPLPLPKPIPGQTNTKKRSGKAADPLAYLSKNSTKKGRKLFTPGPLNVSDRVKSAMQLEVSARHSEFAYITEFVRSSLLQIAKVDKDDFAAIPIGGSGTFVIESTLKTVIGTKNRTILIMSNGTNGDRIAKLCSAGKINNVVIPVDKKCLEETLKNNKEIAAVLAVHCEASTGLINPVKDIGEIVKGFSKDKMFFVDGMTSFGSVPLDMKNVDFVVSNSCKSLHSVPGIAFVIARKEMLEKMRLGDIERLMDIGAYLEDLDGIGKTHFSPPTQVMLAFKEALIEYSNEGSMQGRAAKYKKNNAILKKEMECMGFKPLFQENENPEGYLLTVFEYPKDPLFVYEEFFQRLADCGCLLSGEEKNLSKHFRVANMGNLNENDIRELCMKIKRVLEDMRMEVPFEDPIF